MGEALTESALRARERRIGGLMAYAQIFVKIGITLLYTPFMVRTLGQTEYGLFAIGGALAAYLVILDMGLSDSVVRKLVGLHGAGNEAGERHFLGGMLSVYACIGGGVLLAAGVLMACVPIVFGETLGQAQWQTLQWMLVPLALSTAVVVAGNPLNAVLVARERFIFLRSLELVAFVAVTLASVLVLLWGGGVLAVVVVSSAGAVVTTLAKWLMVRYRLGIDTRPSRVERSHLNEMAVYAAPIFVSMLVEQIFWKLDNILIGARIGAAAVAVYAIGIMFNKYFMAFATAISRVMMPDLVRRIDAGANAEVLTQRLIEVSRVQAVVVMLTLSGLVLFGQHFIRTWMGPGYAASYWVMLWTLGPYGFELIGNVRNVILQVKGLYWWRAGIFLMAALLNVPATLIALEHWGVVGAAACTGLGFVAAYFGVAWVLSRKAGIAVWGYLRGVWQGLAPCVMLAVLWGILLRAWLPEVGWASLIVKASLFTAGYLVLMWSFGLQNDERAMVRAALQRRRS